MRTKYNSLYSNNPIAEKSHIEKYLGEEIETILNPDANSIHGVDFDEIYIRMPNIEERLSALKEHRLSDRCVFLTGVTGCGKTSVLRHTFHIQKPVNIQGSSLYITFSFDHAPKVRNRETAIEYFTNNIKSTCEELKKEIELDNKTINDDDFCDFIKKVRQDELQFDDKSEYVSSKTILQTLKANNRIGFYSLKLKYYLTVLQRVNHVAIIVDDIESIGYRNELIPVEIGLSLWTCIKRPPEDETLKQLKTWSTCVIVSCRHYVYRMIHTRLIEQRYVVESGIDSQTLESYPIDDEINIPESVRLTSLIEGRVNKLRSIKTDKRWDDAWTIVNLILNKVDNQFGDFILALAINNVRKALTILKDVILNKRWIQRSWQGKEEVPGVFNINCINEYNLSPPCLLRAIGLKEGTVYSRDDSNIPNILANTREKETDLITLITLNAFLNQTSSTIINWRNSLDCTKTAERIKYILRDSESKSFVDEAIQFLILSRLLLRSQNQAQDDGIDINRENVKDINSVYVSKAAFTLWQQLGRSSVLLELYTDDLYLNENVQKNVEHDSNSLIDQRTFERCVKYVSEMVEYEKSIRSSAKNDGKRNATNSIIGSTFITRQLLCGLLLSREAYFKSNRVFKQELEELTKKINSYEAEINS